MAERRKATAKRAEKLDVFKDYIVARMRAALPARIPVAVLFREIKEQGYQGGETRVKQFVRTLVPAPALWSHRPPNSREGRALTLEEHQAISDWNCHPPEGWPRIELALNYPDTPEMFGVVESGQIGPTLFLWAADWGVVIEPFSGGFFAYPSLKAALDDVSKWAKENEQNPIRLPFRGSGGIQ